MARKGGPALYELLGKTKGLGAPNQTPIARSAVRGPIFRAGEGQWLGVLAVAIAAVVIAYFLGVTRGERLGRAAMLEERAEDAQLAEGARPLAPLPADGGAGVSGAAGRASGNQSAPGNGFIPGSMPGDEPLPPAPEGVDPRPSGLNYCVIATVADQRARAIVDFCRSQGLDARVVKSDNARFSEVIVLPGFPATERSGPIVKELEAQIRKVGVRYKAAARGNPDFGDMYHKLHRP